MQKIGNLENLEIWKSGRVQASSGSGQFMLMRQRLPDLASLVPSSVRTFPEC